MVAPWMRKMWTRLVVMKSVVEAPTFCYRCDRAIVFRIETHAKKREAKVYAELLATASPPTPSTSASPTRPASTRRGR
jgi:hypothetical protein